ncbi:MAG: ABC transporter permease [Acidobacteria bacterium]|nr:ABC transporter permease [Acidobacteriota bacterium]
MFEGNMLDALRRDCKHALRRLVKDWQFSAGAIVILALGIGANAGIFSILNNSLLQPHPFTDSKRLLNIYQNEAKSGEPEGVSYPAFLDLQRESAVFASVGGAQMTEGRYQTLDAQGKTGTIRGSLFEYASSNYLDVLGMRPSLGRWFTAEEEHRAEPVAVLGWTAWKRDFAADPNVLGQTLIVGGARVQVIGVGPATLNSAQSYSLISALWMPIGRKEQRVPKSAASRMLEKRENLFLQVRARLRDGVTLQQAQAAMNVTASRLAADYPDTDPRRGITVLATDDVHIHPRERFLKPAVTTGFAVVGLVLAIACSNLATPLLVRSSARSAEISVRLALGATRWQLIRHLLMESLVLAIAGTAAGVALAHWGLRFLATVDMPVIISMQLDYRVLGFAIVMATLCALAFGLTPALHTTRLDVAGSLRDQRGSSGSSLSLARGWFTLKNALVTGQVTASFLLLVSAGLAMSVLTATQNRSVGYRPEGLAIVETDPRYAGYDMPRALAALGELRARIASLPGVESVFLTIGLPVDGQFEKEILRDGAGAGDSIRVEGRWAGPGYFKTIGIPVLFGRVFDDRDSPNSPEVMVVSEAFARRFFGTPNAVGKRLRFAEADSKPMQIVGVVGNVRSIDMVSAAPKKTFYRSAAQNEVMPTTLVARTSHNEDALVGLMRQEVQLAHPELPVNEAMTMKQRQDKELGLFRVAAVSLGTLGGLGLLLAGVGLYAVVAYAVAQRTNELGIRIALGARSSDLTRLVVGDVTALTVAGIAIGSALSGAAVIVLESSVAQILGVDPLLVVPVALIIVACGAAAAYVPARRAVRTDPIAAIRHQ